MKQPPLLLPETFITSEFDDWVMNIGLLVGDEGPVPLAFPLPFLLLLLPLPFIILMG